MQQNCNLLLQNIKEAILMLDKDGYIMYSNPAATSILGYTPDDLINNHLTKLYGDKEEAVKADYEIRESLKHGKYQVEGWKYTKTGSQVWCEMRLVPLYNEQNIHVGYSCTLLDMSERKKREIELRQSEERYRLMVEGVRDYAIFMLNPTGHIITWNEGARRTKGYSSYEIIGKHFSTFYTAEDLENGKPARELKIAIETGKYEEEGWRIKKNGSVFWANVVITSLFNEQNKHIGFSKVTRDLTERKENEESLRQSEERYRSLVEQVTDYGIFMLDERGRIISWNEGARRMKGYNPDEIIGKYFSIFYPEEDILNGKPSHELKVAREVGKYEEEGWRLRKDGTRFWANVVITAVYNYDGALIGYSKVTRDLTERKEAERALRDSYERYRQLSEELKIINEELTLANEELEQFTSIVSHDLQEPVRTIKSFLQLIDMKLNNQQYEDMQIYITKSVNAANRMKELIQNLLSYTQVSKKEISEDEVNVQELLNQALQNVKTSVDTTNAEIIIESEVDTIHGDSIQLVQLIQNLLSNALKFTEAESPRIMIKCNKEDGQVKFAISDNGIGIAEDDLSKIFEIFRRLNTRKEYPGTGIGLAICKKIVDRHRGKIWPVSEKGKGTTFYFTISEEKVDKLPILQ
ncbi:PAS domain-containing sensor histidine kinase [Telluribacter sp. SYSU D00476]|uniref:PAS domain-containing sensor histidine kinase n=1 Tax=Telluribacter sp. SYSU D00476 TaxID=2811430 RepID=UPI001FF34222|nr:PAS domain-containing sensor histidine kinase [Telluribacter sp. SYSU D00476]